MTDTLNYTPLKNQPSPPTSPQLVVNTVNKPKFPLKVMVPTLMMAILGTGVILGNLAVSKNSSINTKASGRNNREEALSKYRIKISPTQPVAPTIEPTATPTPEYTNLFDEKAETENPFSETINPFDSLL
jgi:hypothetical protein